MLQERGAKRGSDGNIRSVAPCGHEDAAHPGLVVAGVHGDPAAVEKDLIPGGEIARAGVGPADVSELACRVAGGDFLAARKCDGEVLKVAADPDAFGEDVQGRLGGAGGLIVEADFFVDPVPDGSGAGPAGRHPAEEVLGDGDEAVDLAVSRGKEELEDVVGSCSPGPAGPR